MDMACWFPKLVHTGNLILTSKYLVFHNLKDIEYNFEAWCIRSVKNQSTWLVALEVLYLRRGVAGVTEILPSFSQYTF